MRYTIIVKSYIIHTFSIATKNPSAFADGQDHGGCK